jgi:putative redox protein
MKITLDRVNDAVHLVGKNEAGNEVHIDGSVNIGGEGLGASPMQLVLMALGGCSSMDVLSILKKMKQEVKNYRVEITGERAVDTIPAVFTNIQVHFILEGDLDADKIEKAIQLSMDKYCSVTKMLETTVKIEHSFEISSKD